MQAKRRGKSSSQGPRFHGDCSSCESYCDSADFDAEDEDLPDVTDERNVDARALTRQTIDRVMSFPFGALVARYAKEQGFPKMIAQAHERELRRFLVVSALHPDIRSPMFTVIDKLWHELILETKLYEDFCLQAVGRFIHHSRVDKKGKITETRAHLEAFRKAYLQHFGEPAPKEYWPDLAPKPRRKKRPDPTPPRSPDCNGSDCYC